MRNPHLLLDGMTDSAEVLKSSVDGITQATIKSFLLKIEKLRIILDDISDLAQLIAEKSNNKDLDNM